MAEAWSSWLQAIGTVGTLALLAWVEYRRFRAKRSEQASLISVWHIEGTGGQKVGISNRSEQPVYDFCLGWYDPASHYDTGKPGHVWSTGTLPPCISLQIEASLPTRMGLLPSLIFEFIDRNGVSWRREYSSLTEVRSHERLLHAEAGGATWSHLHGPESRSFDKRRRRPMRKIKKKLSS